MLNNKRILIVPIIVQLPHFFIDTRQYFVGFHFSFSHFCVTPKIVFIHVCIVRLRRSIVLCCILNVSLTCFKFLRSVFLFSISTAFESEGQNKRYRLLQQNPLKICNWDTHFVSKLSIQMLKFSHHGLQIAHSYMNWNLPKNTQESE